MKTYMAKYGWKKNQPVRGASICTTCAGSMKTWKYGWIKYRPRLRGVVHPFQFSIRVETKRYLRNREQKWCGIILLLS